MERRRIEKESSFWWTRLYLVRVFIFYFSLYFTSSSPFSNFFFGCPLLSLHGGMLYISGTDKKTPVIAWLFSYCHPVDVISVYVDQKATTLCSFPATITYSSASWIHHLTKLEQWQFALIYHTDSWIYVVENIRESTFKSFCLIALYSSFNCSLDKAAHKTQEKNIAFLEHNISYKAFVKGVSALWGLD